MFATLLESRHSSFGLPRWGVAVAVGLHAALVGAALRTPPPPPEQPRSLSFELPPLDGPPGPPRVDLPGLTLPGPIHIVLPPVPSPDRIPGVPSVAVPSPDRPVLAVEEPSAPGGSGGTGPVPVSLVQDPPVLLSAPVPTYPAELRAAGVAGVVVVQVVVDTTGRPEPGTLRVVRSTNDGFDPAAAAAIRGALFRPGRIWGRAVRVLVQVPVAFRLQP